MENDLHAGLETPNLKMKAIPLHRDHLQSRLLIVVIGSLLGVLITLSVTRHAMIPSPLLLASVAVSCVFGLAVSVLRAATPGGALSGASICLLLMFWTAPSEPDPSPALILHTALPSLILLFVCTFLATRSGRSRKQARGLAEGRRGRSASQVLANLSVAALAVSVPRLLSKVVGVSSPPLQSTAYALALAALAEATADTVSSEIGQAFGGTPRMLLTLRPSDVGTDGAVTALGTAAGTLAALAIALVGAWTMALNLPQMLAAALGGIGGLLFDSLLGATAERRGWLGNDLVNFTSTAFAVGLAALILKR